MGLFSRNKKGPTYRYKSLQDQERALQRLLRNVNAGLVNPGSGLSRPVHGARALVPDENGVPSFIEYADQGNGKGAWKKPDSVVKVDVDNKRHRKYASERRTGKKGEGGGGGGDRNQYPASLLPQRPPPDPSNLPSAPPPARRSRLVRDDPALPPRSHAGSRLPADIPGRLTHSDPIPAPRIPSLPAENQQHQRQHPLPIPYSPQRVPEHAHTQAPHPPRTWDPLATQPGPLGRHGRRAHVPGQTAVQAQFPGTLTDPGERYRYLAELERLRRENADAGRGR